MKDIILAVIGQSGSGKSFLTKIYNDKGYNVIQSATTREPRYKDEWGHEFVSIPEAMLELTGDKDFNPNKMVPEEYLLRNIIAYTYYYGNHYYASKRHYQEKGLTFYVIDPYGAKVLKNLIIDAKLILLYINVDEDIRRQRMIKRFIEDNKGKYKESDLIKLAEESAESRIENDRSAFKNIEFDYEIFNNGTSEEAVKAIYKILELEELTKKTA